MNLLVPDSWLREFLETNASPKQIKEYLSLCGPSVEHISEAGKEIIYDIEVTSNRPDSMSILGIAREAATILPRFKLQAKLINDPYAIKTKDIAKLYEKLQQKPLSVTTDPVLNPRWTSIVIDHVKVGPSPQWLKKRLESTGIRSLNNVIDITNYLMRAYGQPAHAFDYDEIKPKDGVPAMILRASRKGEKIITLDGKVHLLPGDDIVIEDGAGRLIDLCGIMGAENSSIKDSTKTVVLFMQTYDPAHIRRTSMKLAHRTEAASLFEKSLDSELVLPTIVKGIELMRELTGGTPASAMYDIYPKSYTPYDVSVSRKKVDNYLGKKLDDNLLTSILTPLGFAARMDEQSITVMVPSWRGDIQIDVDIVEEIARIYGYHNIASKLPEAQPPVDYPDTILTWESEIKTRLRDWGITETYTYSMISEELMDLFGLDKEKTYKIANPLSKEWVFMRPNLLPSVLSNIRENLNHKDTLRLFELSMIYEYRQGNLPKEKPVLLVAWVDRNSTEEKQFRQAKGLAQALFNFLGVPVPRSEESSKSHNWLHPNIQYPLPPYGALGQLHPKILDLFGIRASVTLLELNLEKLIAKAEPLKTYVPVPKFPPLVEDMTFVIPPDFRVGVFMETLKTLDPLIKDIALLDMYQNARTFRITYQHKERNLTTEDIVPTRQSIIRLAEEKFQAMFKK